MEPECKLVRGEITVCVGSSNCMGDRRDKGCSGREAWHAM
jgi:hypothetical protein